VHVVPHRRDRIRTSAQGGRHARELLHIISRQLSERLSAERWSREQVVIHKTPADDPKILLRPRDTGAAVRRIKPLACDAGAIPIAK
jgi:hypothetical protein